MRAMLMDQAHTPLRLSAVAIPTPGPGQVLIRVRTCAVCRTDLHVVDGELTKPKLPLIPGHEIVGSVDGLGPGATLFQPGDRVGVPWVGFTCGTCAFCLSGRENLCDQARFTGYQIDGGYAEYTVADQRFCFAIPAGYSDAEAAPLLCAGLIGYRSLRMAGDGPRLGLYGFGAAAHIIAQVAIWQGRRIFAFSRPGDTEAQDFARSLGAVWAGGSDQMPPEPLDAAIIFAPVGGLVPAALRAVGRDGGLCGYPHECDPQLFVRSAVGGTGGSFGCQPDPARCGGISGAGASGSRADDDGSVPVGAGERGAGRSARGAVAGCGGAGGLIGADQPPEWRWVRSCRHQRKNDFIAGWRWWRLRGGRSRRLPGWRIVRSATDRA